MSLLNAIDSVPPFACGGPARAPPVAADAGALALVPGGTPGPVEPTTGLDGAFELATGVHAAASRPATTSNAARGRRGLPCDAIEISSSSRRSWFGRRLTPVMGVEGVREGVPEQVEREDRDHDREAGQDHEARVRVVVAEVLADHLAPRGGRQWDAHAEERQRRLEQHRRGDP